MSITTTPVYDTFWHFAAERQAIYMKRIKGEPRPWTNDRILDEYKFTNAYRAADRVSQYLIHDVVYRGDLTEPELQTPNEIFFRIILFKLFNRIDTWEWLNTELLDPVITTYDLYRGHVKFVLDELVKNKRPIYTGAYMTPSPPKSLGSTKYEAHINILMSMLMNQVPEKLLECKTMEQGYRMLRDYPMIGNFMAYQLITDLNYSDVYNWSEMEFTTPGPGALDGIAKCFSDLGNVTPNDAIRMVTQLQEHEFTQRGLAFPGLWGRPLQLIDVQNLFCEISKYARVAHPEIKGKSDRTNIKAKHTGERLLPRPWFPPKWGINQD